MKKYIFTIVALALFVCTQGQTYKSYRLILPKITPNPEAKTVFVEGYKAREGEAPNQLLESSFYEYVTKEINNSERGGDIEYIPNLWLRTDLYELVDSKEKADIILKGSYAYTEEKRRETKYVIQKEAEKTKKTPIPYEVEYYDLANILTVEFDLECKESKTGKFLFGLAPTNDVFEDRAKNPMWPTATLHDFDVLARSFSNMISNSIGDAFLPRFTEQKYKFEKVKGPSKKEVADKDRRKEIEKMLDEARDLIRKENDIVGAGMIYKSLEEEMSNENFILNLAMVNEIVGNYAQAKEYYAKINNESGVLRARSGIKIRELYQSFGKEIEDVEL